jgi:hypothetical protein
LIYIVLVFFSGYTCFIVFSNFQFVWGHPILDSELGLFLGFAVHILKLFD